LLNEQGVVKAAGVSNFYPDRLVDLIDRTGFTPAVNQIETHPFHQRHADHDLMIERGVQHESWGGFAEGRTTSSPTPPSPRSAKPTTSRRLRARLSRSHFSVGIAATVSCFGGVRSAHDGAYP
jgi:diketogulonate reductase-like aldo/keto reductase